MGIITTSRKRETVSREASPRSSGRQRLDALLTVRPRTIIAIVLVRALAVVASLFACSASDDIHAPSVAGVAPDHAMPGVTVAVQGSYFCQQPDSQGGDVDPLACANVGNVAFGSQVVIPQQYTDTSIMVQVPQAAPGPTSVSVTVAGRVSNTVSFTID
jgi:hypothetical protein